MATVTTTTEPTHKTAPLFETTIGKTGAKREMYGSFEAYYASVEKLQSEAGETLNLVPQVTFGLNEDGTLNEDAYTKAGLFPTLAFVTRDAKKTDGVIVRPREVVAIVTYGAPSLESVQEAGPDAVAWLRELIAKEAHAVAVKKFRVEGYDFTNAENELPASIADFYTRSTSSAVKLTDGQKKVLADVRQWPSSKVADWAAFVAARGPLDMGTFILCLRSAAYAKFYFGQFETLGDGSSAFQRCLERAIALAAGVGESTDVFAGWAESRDTLDLSPASNQQVASLSDWGEDTDAEEEAEDETEDGEGES